MIGILSRGKSVAKLWQNHTKAKVAHFKRRLAVIIIAIIAIFCCDFGCDFGCDLDCNVGCKL